MDPKTWLTRKRRISIWEYVFWIAALILPFFVFPTYLALAAQIAITATFCISLDLILGYAGIISLGHAAFFGVGAYTAGILSVNGWGEPISGLIIAGIVAAAVGWLVSFIVVRVQHLAQLMITIAMVFLFYEIANVLPQYTGGADGLQGIDTWKLLGIWKFTFWGYTAFGYAFTVAFLCFLLARFVVHSPFGLTMEALRENPDRTTALGAPNEVHLQKIFTIAAGIAGVAGALLAQTTETVSLEVLGFQRSAELAIMLILGGTGRLYGAILGVIIFMIARDQLADMNPQFWYFWIGLLLMGVVLFMPRGALGGLQSLSKLGARK